LNSNLYLGLKRRRATGKEYDDCLDVFVEAVQELFPMAMLHFEDFGLDNARRLLEKYQPQLACFNGASPPQLVQLVSTREFIVDDIQGTGCVTQAAIKAATWVTKEKLTDQKIIIFGAGTAGTGIPPLHRSGLISGIADQLRDMMVLEGLSKEEATKHVWFISPPESNLTLNRLIDKIGLCMKRHGDKLTSAQKPFARDNSEFPDDGKKIDLLTVVKNVKPNILIGCSTVPGAFTEEVVREMASHVARPIIFPLSNPTRLHEAQPKDISAWTGGRALVATGSPFHPVLYDGKEYEIAECNNCLVYPGIGLGCVLSRAERLSDEMIVAAAHGCAELSPALKDPVAALLPDINDVRATSVEVAMNVIQQCVKEGLNRIKNIPEDEKELRKWIEDQMWKPEYRHLEKVAEHIASKEAKGELGIKSRA
jgi:malate dehydrogenase (oxaloacetate-decarboxylating)